MDGQGNPFENSLFRSMIGLTGGITVAVIAVLFFEGTMRLLLLGIAVADTLVTPYILKRAATQQREQTEAGTR
jgi:hypothetical protein